MQWWFEDYFPTRRPEGSTESEPFGESGSDMESAILCEFLRTSNEGEPPMSVGMAR